MQEVGKQHTKAALVNDLLFVSTFVVCRLLCGPVVVYRTLRCGSSHRVVKWGGAGIQCISILWFYRIVQARRLAWPRPRSPSACLSVQELSPWHVSQAGARKARAVREARKSS